MIAVKPCFIETTTGSDDDFAEVTEKINLEKFKTWIVESLQTYLSLKNKIPEGNLETLVYGLVLFSHSANTVLLYLAWFNEDIVSVLYM